MLTLLPSGLLGLVVASLVAAYMSTISTHLNWGSSYIVNDFYKQQIKKDDLLSLREILKDFQHRKLMINGLTGPQTQVNLFLIK